MGSHTVPPIHEHLYETAVSGLIRRRLRSRWSTRTGTAFADEPLLAAPAFALCLPRGTCRGTATLPALCLGKAHWTLFYTLYAHRPLPPNSSTSTRTAFKSRYSTLSWTLHVGLRSLPAIKLVPSFIKSQMPV